jgi:hypothetical protein
VVPQFPIITSAALNERIEIDETPTETNPQDALRKLQAVSAAELDESLD